MGWVKTCVGRREFLAERVAAVGYEELIGHFLTSLELHFCGLSQSSRVKILSSSDWTAHEVRGVCGFPFEFSDLQQGFTNHYGLRVSIEPDP